MKERLLKKKVIIAIVVVAVALLGLTTGAEEAIVEVVNSIFGG